MGFAHLEELGGRKCQKIVEIKDLEISFGEEARSLLPLKR